MWLINFHFKNILSFVCVLCIAMLAVFGVQTHASAGGVPSMQTSSTRITMYRLCNQYTGEHFYTASSNEKTTLVASGWSDEGVGWYAPWFAISKSNTPVYRLYNPYAPGGDHHYTASKSEYDSLKEEGWIQEGVGWYSIDGIDADKKAIYRQYNSNEYSCNHNYTIATDERDSLIGENWNDEGIGWYGYASEKAVAQVLDFSKITVTTTSKFYNGNAQTQTVSSSAYKLNTDYTVTYSNNTNAGTATIIVKGTGNYSGSKTYTFKINPVEISKANVELGDSLTYTGKEQTQEIKSVTAGNFTLSTSDYTVVNNKATNAGDYTLTVTGKGNYSGSKTCTFKINPADISKANVELGNSLTYNTKEQTQEIKSVTAGIFTLSTSDYTITNNKATNAGDYTLTVTGKGNFIGSTKITFTVEKATPVCSAPTGLTGKLGDTLLTVDLNSSSVSGNTAGKFTWTEPIKKMSGAGNKEYSAEFVPTDTSNYSTVTSLNIAVQVVESSYDGGFWLGTKNAGSEYVNEAYFAKQDPNYISGTEISAEMKVLHDSTNSNYTAVKAWWEKYYTDDNVRLYATYSGGETETAYDGASVSELNKYVEFRILEVSGASGHKLHDGITSDGSVVTFMATHVLPSAYQLNNSITNVGGWGSCQLRKDLNEVDGTKGEIYGKFSSDFVKNVKSVVKEYNAGGSGNSQTATPSTVENKFWIPSYTELVNPSASDYDSSAPMLEGTQYAWCEKCMVNAFTYNNCLAYTTRAGVILGLSDDSYSDWWERSPSVTFSSTYCGVDSHGDPSNGNTIATIKQGIVPAFCF